MEQCARVVGATLLLQLLVLSLSAGFSDAACERVDNPDLIAYSCEGGSLEDLSKVPSTAEKIRIVQMPIGRLEESSFGRFAENLLVLSCSHCQITEIEDGALGRLVNLQQLSLDNNRLSKVRASWFKGLENLTYLDLNANEIELIDGDVFRNAPDLVDLRLSGNRLQCLDLEALSRLHGLKRIFINENPSFGCPNALKRFLSERQVDFDTDPHWDALGKDRVSAVEPPAEERYPPLNAHNRWATEPPLALPPLPPTTTTTTTTEREYRPPPPPPRAYEPPEMIQPSAPDMDIPPYYVPKVSQQQLDSYRDELIQQARNASDALGERAAGALANATLPPNVLVAGQLPAVTTDCPNPNAAQALRQPSLLLLPLGLLLLALRRISC